jgi:hypothetical protein
VRLVPRQFAGALGKGPFADLPYLEAKAPQQGTDGIVEVTHLANQQFAGAEQAAHFLRQNRLDVHGPEPAGAHDLRDGARRCDPS